jgi:thiol-disulfide isomerase/thioredoxin
MTMPHDPSRRAVLGSAGLLLAGWPAVTPSAQPSLFGTRSPMPDFSGAVAWLNSAPLRAEDLRGKVVLVQFWTFTCVNWLRTFPALQAWAAKYRDAGLVVVGVHTPEFSFERDLANVREAAAQLQVTHPVAVDSRQAVWAAWRNNAWPALYLVDAMGAIRHRHDGEGEYEATEQWIQKLLAQAGARDVPGGLVKVQGKGTQAAANWATLRSPETYTGHGKAERFASPGGISPDRRRVYERPGRLGGNAWAVSGDWTIGEEAARCEAPAARLAYRFQARDVNLVLGATRREQPVPIRVRIDGQPPGADHGSDTDAGGRAVVAERRLYQLVRQAGAVRDREVEIEFLAPGAEVYAFTFG